jgi:hypothetical protein
MPRRYISLQECLFSAFANPQFDDPQEHRQLWAIHEGLARLERDVYPSWSAVDARKEHNCIRGHLINDGDVYFKFNVGAGWTSDWKFCAGCTAMILYFKEVDKLPPVFHTHWDLEKKEPVRLKDEQE